MDLPLNAKLSQEKERNLRPVLKGERRRNGRSSQKMREKQKRRTKTLKIHLRGQMEPKPARLPREPHDPPPGTITLATAANWAHRGLS